MEPESVRILKWVYLIVFITAGAFVAVLTATSGSIFEPIRFSNLIVPNATGTEVVNVFRFLVGFYLFLILVDAVALFNYKVSPLREISSIASLIGFFLMGLSTLFMVYVMGISSGGVGETTLVALLYLVLAVGLFLLDLLTFFVDEQELLGIAVKKKAKK